MTQTEQEIPARRISVTALAGGVGAAKLLAGVARAMPPEDLTIIVNTGDDIDLHGLRICPDLDTITYTLAGLIDPDRGWGLRGETFECLRRLEQYGQECWFNLGDRDLATHIYRTNRLRLGFTLSAVTDSIRKLLNIASRIIPMTDDPAQTQVVTERGEMHFQEYFVRYKHELIVKSIDLGAARSATPARGVIESLIKSGMIIICPSNPLVSTGPILEVPGIRDALKKTEAAVVAVSPIVGGKALKGPAAEMLRSLGHEVSALGVARLYQDILDFFIVDEVDAVLGPIIQELGIQPVITQTVMRNEEDSARLAGQILELV